jgi:hypothetical protein
MCARDQGALAPGLAGPPGPPKVLPQTAIRVALRVQDLRARILGGVELKNHPLWIRNPRIRRRVQQPGIGCRGRVVFDRPYPVETFAMLVSLLWKNAFSRAAEPCDPTISNL